MCGESDVYLSKRLKLNCNCCTCQASIAFPTKVSFNSVSRYDVIIGATLNLKNIFRFSFVFFCSSLIHASMQKLPADFVLSFMKSRSGKKVDEHSSGNYRALRAMGINQWARRIAKLPPPPPTTIISGGNRDSLSSLFTPVTNGPEIEALLGGKTRKTAILINSISRLCELFSFTSLSILFLKFYFYILFI